MPRFGFVGEQGFPHLVALEKPALFVAITVRAFRAGHGNVPTMIDSITDKWYEGYQDRDEVNKELLELYERLKDIPDDQLVVFGCDYGRSRSRVAASVFARLFGHTTLTSASVHTNPGDEPIITSGHDYELLDDISVNALVDRYTHILKLDI